MQLKARRGALAVAGLVACMQAAGLQDQFQVADARKPFDQRLRFEIAAPIIVLGHVLEIDDVGRPLPSTGDRRIGVQLNRIKIDVEDVIKGDVRSSPLQFYYFAYSPGASELDLGAPRYLPSIGQRRIFFLKRFEGVYRSVGDVIDYTLRVSSGRHPRGSCVANSPGCCIAEILLVPQHDVDTRRFVTDLIESEYASEVLCSTSAVQQLVQTLLRNPDRRISEAARQVIAATQSSQR